MRINPLPNDKILKAKNGRYAICKYSIFMDKCRRGIVLLLRVVL
jgi:hypothetical protein